MIYSRYNIFSRIKDSENYFILNLLTGNADILDPDEAKKLEKFRSSSSGMSPKMTEELLEKGYLTDEAKEVQLYRNRYLDFIDSRGRDEIQIFFVTNYSCNFACSYCYQDQYNNPKPELSDEITDAFFQLCEH